MCKLYNIISRSLRKYCLWLLVETYATASRICSTENLTINISFLTMFMRGGTSFSTNTSSITQRCKFFFKNKYFYILTIILVCDSVVCENYSYIQIYLKKYLYFCCREPCQQSCLCKIDLSTAS